MKLKYCLLVLLWPVVNCFAQSFPSIHPLTVGDKVPDITLTNVYNYPVSKIQLSSFKGRLAILDFWATWCGSCIEAFPKLQNLKNKFGSDLQLLLVNNYAGDDEKKVTRFFEKRKARTGQQFHLPYILQDSVLNKYFPHTGSPHCVWLNDEGRVLAITYASDITEANIRSFLNGGQPLLHTKNDQLLFNTDKPLLVDGNGGACNEFIYRSVVTKYKEDLGGAIGNTLDSTGKMTRFYAINCRLMALLQIAYPDVLKYPPSRTILDNPDIDYQQKFCYEIITAPTSENEMLRHMQADLFRNFHLLAKNEFRKIRCYVLAVNKNSKISVTNGDTPESDIEKDSRIKFIRNRPVSELTDILAAVLDMSVINETGFKYNIDLTLPANLYTATPQSLKAFLQQSGFDLILTSRKLEVAVITDKAPLDNLF